MTTKYKFDICCLKGWPGRLRDRLMNRKVPPKILFIILGIVSTVWFLARVIPKPSRATYPCMRVAAPFMSGLIIYLLSVASITVASRRFKWRKMNVRYPSAFLLLFFMVAVIAINPSSNVIKEAGNIPYKTGPDDGPNQPFGTPLGVNPGRVVWAWDTAATRRNCEGYYFSPENNNQEVISRMFDQSVEELAGINSVAGSWDAMFRYFNSRKHHVSRSYVKGEKIFIKINQTSGRGRLRQPEREKGNYYYPESDDDGKRDDGRHYLGTCETDQYIVLQLLRQLVNDCGIDQSDIAVGDPQNPTYGHNYDAWSAEFPRVVYCDRTFGTFGRTLIHPTTGELVFYSDKFQTDKLYDVIENADYLINVANLKPHSGTGITLTAKNHFGSQSRAGAYHLHYSHISQIEGKPPTNPGYHKYRVLVDLMGSKYLGRNTLLYIIDGLYAGGSNEGGPPVKYFMAPFSGNWSSSIFISQDQVALESVCFDLLRAEWNGTYVHDPSNNYLPAMPDINGVDDYLHQAADSSNWPEGIRYDPDNSGSPIPSLGVHEHWNNPVNKQYSRNLGKSFGIELVSIPGYIVGAGAPAMVPQAAVAQELTPGGERKKKDMKTAGVNKNALEAWAATPASLGAPNIGSVTKRSLPPGFAARKFYAGVIDDNNGKYFLTDAGIVRGNLFSVNGRMNFEVVGGNPLELENVSGTLPPDELRQLVYELSGEGPKLWIATTDGVVAAKIGEEEDIRDASVFNTTNSGIRDNNVVSVALGRNQLRWFGTLKGISALRNDKWLDRDYQELYPDNLFEYSPVTALATSVNGDTLFVATEGAGVARVYRDEADAISGASSYMQWGPIEIPSDTVYSLCIARDGSQWIGTNRGVARHTGSNTLENWTVFNTGNGLVDDCVQAIATEPYGKNIWFGTRGGITVFDGSGLTSFTVKDGLLSNNILFIMADKNGLVYLGTDKGLMVYAEGKLVCYE